jgi:YVTN family beta-propeller protein
MARTLGWVVCGVLALSACADEGGEPADVGSTTSTLADRAYIVSLESDELTVIDTKSWEILGRVKTGGQMNHMAELSPDFTKVFVDSSHSDQVIVVDATKFEVTNRLPLGKHPAHLTLTHDGSLLAIMAEDSNEVVFVDPETEQVVKRLGGFSTPHFMRFPENDKFGYVANIGGNHITRVDMETLEIDAHLPLQGMSELDEVADEGGFADAQIDSDGILYAAHNQTGRLFVYDTQNQRRLPELSVGRRPRAAFAEHPFEGVALRHVVPNFADRSLSIIDAERALPKVVATLAEEGDEESYGVNFSPLAPNLAFVMNRVRKDVAVHDTVAGKVLKRIFVGGNTETASTTADGKYIVAAVSGANRVVVIEVATQRIHKIFENVGKYPWSVTIPNGQNYCH